MPQQQQLPSSLHPLLSQTQTLLQQHLTNLQRHLSSLTTSIASQAAKVAAASRRRTNLSRHNTPQSLSAMGKQHQHSFRRVSKTSVLCGYVLIVIFVIGLCLEQVRNDVLFADMLSSDGNLADDDDDTVAVTNGRLPPHRGASLQQPPQQHGMLDQRAFEEHELQALVQGEGDEEDGMVVNNVQEQDAAWEQVQQVFDKSDAAYQTKWWNAKGLVHVIHTKVLQNQPRLVDLTRARLRQFQTFTVPSLQHQTNDEFLWLLWTDPSLLPETEDALKQAVKHLPNVVVIGYKKHRPYGIRSPWFRETFDQSYLIAGSYKRLMSHHKAAQSHAVLDTFVDSDDALSLNFVQLLQNEAAQALTSADRPKAFGVWCPSQTLQWSFDSPPWQLALLQHKRERYIAEHAQLETDQAHAAAKKLKPYYFASAAQQAELDEQVAANLTKSLKRLNQTAAKLFAPKGHWTSPQKVSGSTHQCHSTAGSSIGVSAAATLADDFPMLPKALKQPRETWHQTILPCDDAGEANCLGFLQFPHDENDNKDDGPFGKAVLLRSKTITAAETKSIVPKFAGKNQHHHHHGRAQVEAQWREQEDAWNDVAWHHFGIAATAVQKFHADFGKNLDKILLDMLTICLPSNACSLANKQALQDLLATVGLAKKKEAANTFVANGDAIQPLLSE